MSRVRAKLATVAVFLALQIFNMATLSATEKMTEREISYLKDNITIKSVKFRFEDGTTITDVWDYITKSEYGTVTNDHTNIPQGAVWLLRSRSTKVKSHQRRVESMKYGKFPDTKEGKSDAKGASAIAPTNLTVGTFDYYLSLPASTRGAQRFGQLMYILENLAQSDNTLHGELNNLTAFRVTDFLSRVQLAVALTLPQPVSNEKEYQKRWHHGKFDDFHVRYNNDWQPLLVEIKGTGSFGFDMLYDRTFEL